MKPIAFILLLFTIKSTLAQKEDVYIDKNTYIVQVDAVPTYTSQASLWDLNADGSKNNKLKDIYIEDAINFWDISNGVCWVSNTTKAKASPSIKACY